MTEETKPLVDQTADALTKYIIEHDLIIGQRLPNEKDLSELLGVGRSTLREAVRMLTSRNILEVRHGAGIFVSEKAGISDDPLGFAFIRDKAKLIEDLMDLRLMLEPRVAAMAALNASPEQLKELSRLCCAVEQDILSGGAHDDSDCAFHTKIAECSGNVVMPNLYPIIRSSIRIFISETNADLWRQTIQAHRAIMDAMEKGDSNAAHDAMFLHLIHNRDYLRQNSASFQKAAT